MSSERVHRMLVIADDSCAPTELAPAVAGHAGDARVTAFVVAPALGSRIARWTGDEHAYQEAEKHLEATLAALADVGVEATGHIGAHDPHQALEDGLREFPADEIVLAVHPSGESNWLEKGLVDDARNRYSIPITELTVTTAGE